MAKLIDNPDVRDLVAAEVLKAKTKDRKTITKIVGEIAKERAADAKTAGNRDAARYITTLGLDLKTRIAEVPV